LKHAEKRMTEKGKKGSRREIITEKYVLIVKEKENKVKQNGRWGRERSGT